jgi:hypothetical protein
MTNHIIELQDGIRIEVEPNEEQLQRISGGTNRVDSSIDAIKPLLLNACKPIMSVWQELNKDMAVAEAKVEISLGFEAEGNVFIAKGKTNASLTLSLTLKPNP